MAAVREGCIGVTNLHAVGAGRHVVLIHRGIGTKHATHALMIVVRPVCIIRR